LPDASNPAGNASDARQAEARPRARAQNYAFDPYRTSNQHVHSYACDLASQTQPVIADGRARAARARRRKLVNAEVVGDCVYACEPEDKQRDRERADERERNQAKARDSVEHELPRATGQPPGSHVSRDRFGRHRT
jgi:hypothetical protein